MRILFFAHLKNLTGCSEIDLPVDDLDSEQLWARLLQRFPELARVRSQIRLSRNCDFADATTRFRAADEVALLPPVSGG
jgi:molybdopterin converting factor subunit 1